MKNPSKPLPWPGLPGEPTVEEYETKRLAAIVALNHMMEKGYLSICTIDSIGKMMGINPQCEAYDTLRTLHCVNFAKMPRELREQIPKLIHQCLSMEPSYRFHIPEQAGGASPPAPRVQRLKFW